MKTNMGMLDRGVRIAIAVALFLAIIMQWLAGPLAWIAGIIAVVFVATSFVKFCPLYTVIGKNTLPK